MLSVNPSRSILAWHLRGGWNKNGEHATTKLNRPCYWEMNTLLLISALLLMLIGVAHSYLGERYILIRLFKRGNLPKTFGGEEFTRRTLRFAWHITSIAWWGFAAILVLLANQALNFKNIAMTISITFLLTFATVLIGSKGKHWAWIVFLVVGGVCQYAAIYG